MGNDINILSLEAMKNMFEIAATNLKLAQKKGDPQDQPSSTKLQPGDMVLIQNHVKGPFDPKYIGDYRVVSLKGNQVEIQTPVGGPTEMKHIKHVKHILLPLIHMLSNYLIILSLEERTTLRMNPNQVPDLHWKLANTYHTTNIGQLETRGTTASVHNITVETFSYAMGNRCIEWCRTSLSTKTITTQSRQEPAVCSFIPIT